MTGFVYWVTSAVAYGDGTLPLSAHCNAEVTKRALRGTISDFVTCFVRSAVPPVGIRAYQLPACIRHHLLPQQALGHSAARMVLSGDNVHIHSIRKVRAHALARLPASGTACSLRNDGVLHVPMAPLSTCPC